MKYRKKPVVIEAEQYHGQRVGGVCVGVDCLGRVENHNPPHIHTLEGAMIVSDGDWVITCVNGERYPCKPDIFAKTYEPFEESQNAE